MMSGSPTVARPISVSGSSTVTSTSAALSVLGSDAAGASKLNYDWSITSEPAGASAGFSVNDNNAAQNTTLTFSKAGTYGVSVKIIDPSGLSVTNSLTVNVSATLTSIRVTTPSNAVVNPGTSLQVSAASQALVAQGLDQFGNVMAVQPTFKWSSTTAPSGAPAPGLSASGATETITFGKAGSYTEAVQATSASGAVIKTTAAMLVVAKPTYVTVTQVGGATTITGTTAQFTVSQFQDQFHSPVTESSTSVTWAVTTHPSGVASPTFSTSGANTTAAFKAAGQYVLTATETDSAHDSVSQSITVTVAQQAASMTRSAALTFTGTSAKLIVPTIADQFGNALASQPAITWSATTLPSGAAAPSFVTASGMTTITFAMAGSYSLTAKDASATNVSTVVTVTVVPTLTSIVVTPGSATVSTGGKQQFVAQGLDQFKHALAAQPAFTWSTSGGTITIGGLFTAASTAGSDTITAHNGSLTGTTTISVQGSSNFLNLQNAFLAQDVQTLDASGSITRNDMIQILDAVAAKGAVTASEFSDLKTIVSDAATLNMPNYVQVLSADVVDGNVANATYQGHTLGNLATGSTAIQLTDLVDKWFLGTDLPTLTDSSLVYKTAAGSLFPTTPSHTNEYQGELGDCYLISALGTIADRDPAAIENMIINNGDGTYTVRFYTGSYGSSYNASNGSFSDGFTNGTGTAEYVTVNLQLPTTTSGMLDYADYGASVTNANNALWIPLIEKAYAQWNQTGQEGRDGTNSYASIEGGWMATVDAQVLGHNATDYEMGTATEQQLINALASGQAVTIGTTETIYGLYGSHAYAVTGYNASSNTFTLYNPWGFDQPGQLTWAQLETSCSAFTAVTASGATPISGAPSKPVVGGAIVSDALGPSAAAASAGQTSSEDSDVASGSNGGFATTANVSQAAVPTSGADSAFARFAAFNPAGSDVDNDTSLGAEVQTQRPALAVTALHFGNAANLDLAQVDLLYAALGAA
jgi:hypothetical protein